jgi:hypothetical protein
MGYYQPLHVVFSLLAIFAARLCTVPTILFAATDILAHVPLGLLKLL